MRVLLSAAVMAKEKLGVSCEVIDLRTVYPMETAKMIESVKKTSRCLISHEAPVSSGLGAEVASVIMENCFLNMEAPIKRVCGYDTPFPHIQEPLYFPDMYRVYEGIKETVEY